MTSRMTTSPRAPWGTALALTGAGVLMLAVFLAPRDGLPVQPRSAADQGVLRVAAIDPLVLDPHRRGFPEPTQNQFTLCLWEPLVECDPVTGQPQPAAAESWSWSADRLILTVKLRPDSRWGNGEPVTAHDFVRSWRRLLRQENGNASVLFPLRNAQAYHSGKVAVTEVGLEAADDLTLRITLNVVRSSFVAELADPLLVPLYAAAEDVPPRIVSAPLISNGPFCLVQAGGEGYRLVRSLHYRDRAAVRLAGVEFIQTDNDASARLLMAVGRVDVVSPLSWIVRARMPTVRRVTEAVDLSLQVISLDLNATRGPLSDGRVRRALALAVKRDAFVLPEQVGRMVPAYSWVPDMPGRPALALLREDAGEARRLLAEAGYPGGHGFPVLVFPVNPHYEDVRYYQAWADCWHRELGLRTYLAYGPSEQRRQRIQRGDYDVVAGGLVATVPDAGDMLNVFAHPEHFGARFPANPVITRLMRKADEQTGTARLSLLEQIERQAIEDMATIPMMFVRRRTFLADEVEGWYADPLGRQALKRLSLRSADRIIPVEDAPL